MALISRRGLMLGLLALSLAACGNSPTARRSPTGPSPEMNRLIEEYADKHEVPHDLAHRVVRRESNYNPAARNGQYHGLMQIAPQTARTMGHRGKASELLEPETNLEYGMKYLRGAWLVSDGNQDQAIRWYSRGYYYEAKRRGMLQQVGLKR